MDIAALVAIERIKQLKSRYLRLMDQRRWDEWAALFTDDAVIEVRHAGEHILWEGRDAIVAGNRARNTGNTSIHHAHTPEITLTGPDSATGTWALWDIYLVPDGRVETFGYYEDTYRCEDGDWKVARVGLDLQPAMR